MVIRFFFLNGQLSFCPDTVLLSSLHELSQRMPRSPGSVLQVASCNIVAGYSCCCFLDGSPFCFRGKFSSRTLVFTLGEFSKCPLKIPELLTMSVTPACFSCSGTHVVSNLAQTLAEILRIFHVPTNHAD